LIQCDSWNQPSSVPEVVKPLTSEEEDRAENSLNDRNDQSTMNDKLAQLCRTFVGISSMPQEQFGKVAELVDGKVSSQRRLLPFFPDDPDA